MNYDTRRTNKKNANTYTLSVFGESDDFSDVTDGFIDGAKWADENPKEGLVSIDKACKWFKQVLFIHTSECDEYHNPIVSTDCETINEFINDFCKAMEE